MIQFVCSDACLSRRPKRKLTQRTLLQLNFSQTSKLQNTTGGSSKSQIDVVLRNCDNNVSQDPSNALPALVAGEETDKNCKLSKNLGHNDNSFSEVRSSTLPPKDEVPKSELTNCWSSIFGTTFETFIVGRRYTGHEEIHPGDTLSLLRDPHNVNDSNAIQVFTFFILLATIGFMRLFKGTELCCMFRLFLRILEVLDY